MSVYFPTSDQCRNVPRNHIRKVLLRRFLHMPAWRAIIATACRSRFQNRTKPLSVVWPLRNYSIGRVRSLEIHKAFCRQSVFSNLRSDFAHSLIDKVQNSSVISRNRGLYNRLSSLFVDIELNGFYFQKSSNGIIRSFAPEIAAEQFRFFHGFFECTYDFCRDASPLHCRRGRPL